MPLLLAPALALLVAAFFLPVGAFLLQGLAAMEGGRVIGWPSIAPALAFMADGYRHAVIAETIGIAIATTAIALALGYPVAYALWRVGPGRTRRWLGLVVLSPVLLGLVARTYGWSVILGDHGPVNAALVRLGLTSEPLHLGYGNIAVVIALVHVVLPFVVVPIYVTMLRIDPLLKEAAFGLGASPWATFRTVTVPLTLPGIAAGGVLAVLLSLGAFATPVLLGGGRVQVLSVEIYRDTVDIDWPMAALGSATLLGMSLVATWAFLALGRRGG